MPERIRVDEDTPLYTIGVVATMLDVHPQTLRIYEREGLVKPKRTSRNSRMYSNKDVERLRLILRLTHDLGVNLAGVEIIIKLRGTIDALRNELRRIIEEYQISGTVPAQESDLFKDDAIVPLSRANIVPRPRTRRPKDGKTAPIPE